MTNSADRTIKELIKIDEVSEADTMPIWDDSLEGNNTKKIPVGMLLQSVIDIVHPVGSLYISENPTEPRLIFGGVWEKLPDGVFIRNSGGNAGEVGQIQPEGLPNITGSVGIIRHDSGAFFKDGSWGTEKVGSGGSYVGIMNGKVRNDFDASKGETKTDGSLKTNNTEKVYGKSNHVTPYNVSFHMWKRIS